MASQDLSGQVTPKKLLRYHLENSPLPIRRSNLRQRCMGITDRRMRDLIAELVIDDGFPICNAEDGKGYFHPPEPETAAIDVEIAQLKSRISSTEKRIIALMIIRDQRLGQQMKVKEIEVS